MVGSTHGPRMAAERSKDMLAEAARQRLASSVPPEHRERRAWWVRLVVALRSAQTASRGTPRRAGLLDDFWEDHVGDR